MAFNTITENPYQISLTPMKRFSFQEDNKIEIKTLDFKRKHKNKRIFNSLSKLSLNKTSSNYQVTFDPKPKDCIIIDDSDTNVNDMSFSNNKNYFPDNNSILDEKTHVFNENRNLTQSDEECVILESKEIDFSIYGKKKKIMKPKFLDFKNKHFFSNNNQKNISINGNNFRRLIRKSRKKENENLHKLLNEISQSHNLKVSDETLKGILTEINTQNNENNQELIESSNTEDDQMLELQHEILKQSTFPVVQKEKNIRIGEKYQSKLPSFNQNKQIEILNLIENHKIWECDKIKDNEFEECKKLVQNILRLNSINEEFLCELLAHNNYKIQETVTYCFDNSKNLQAKIIERDIGDRKSSRRTRNSLYNKYLLK